jgi:hypothetical protein
VSHFAAAPQLLLTDGKWSTRRVLYDFGVNQALTLRDGVCLRSRCELSWEANPAVCGFRSAAASLKTTLPTKRSCGQCIFFELEPSVIPLFGGSLPPKSRQAKKGCAQQKRTRGLRRWQRQRVRRKGTACSKRRLIDS